MGKARSFDEMNNIAANMLTHLTACDQCLLLLLLRPDGKAGRSMRFEGSLNVDLNEITMNMVQEEERKSMRSGSGSRSRSRSRRKLTSYLL